MKEELFFKCSLDIGEKSKDKLVFSIHLDVLERFCRLTPQLIAGHRVRYPNEHHVDLYFSGDFTDKLDAGVRAVI